jgi:hypothetical protein
MAAKYTYTQGGRQISTHKQESDTLYVHDKEEKKVIFSIDISFAITLHRRKSQCKMFLLLLLQFET